MLDVDTINSEIELLKAEQGKKIELLQQLRNNTAQTEAEIHHLSGALAMCEKLLNMNTDNARKTK
jgi:hypothetical protein